MQIRDLLLLALRTLAVFLFGLALSQPLWRDRSDVDSTTGERQALHAVLIVDNSMSMGYEPAAGETLLARAQQRAKDYIEELPNGSRISVVPLCGASGTYSLDPYRTATDATAAVDEIEVVDATANINAVQRLAQEASELESNLAKRVVFLSDQQRANWDKRLHAEQLQQFPEMQVVDVAAIEQPENSWISDFRMDDDIADLETPINFSARLRHTGLNERKDVQVSLWVDNVQAMSKRVNLTPGSSETEVVFQHVFADSDLALEPGDTAFVPVKVALSADDEDRLTHDNERYLVAPVVSALPVVFVDEVAHADENSSLNRFGETWPLRRWLVPIVDRNNTARQRVRIIHLTIDEVNQELLADARLVVVAGIQDPAGKVELLREYVQQGGQLLIAAGGEFNPSDWNESAWKNGEGILPVPLEPDFVGQIPGADGAEFAWFELKYNRNESLFKLVDEADTDLAALFSEPFFFQSLRTADIATTQQSLLESETERLANELKELAEVQERMRKFDAMQGRQVVSQEEQARHSADEQLLREMRPNWLKWSAKDHSQDEEPDPAALAIQQRPEPRIYFDNDQPYIIERRLGQGKVVLATSGLKPEWNTLVQTDAVLLFDRLLRGMLNDTMPQRNFTTRESIPLPLTGSAGNLEYELQRPASGEELGGVESLDAGFIGPTKRGLTIHNALRQGIYTITAYEPADISESGTPRRTAWQTSLAVNIDNSLDVSESDLEPLTRKEIDDRLAGEEVPITWVGATDSISLDGVTVRGQNWWMWLAFLVLLLLLVEISVLAWPSVKAAAANETSAAGVQGPRAQTTQAT